MTDNAINVFLTFPPRCLGDGERQIVKEWLAAAPDIATAFVSERRSDNPAYFRKVVIIESGSRVPSFLVHCPNGTNLWLVSSLAEQDDVRQYPDLRAALHAIRPVPATAARGAPVDWMGAARAIELPPLPRFSERRPRTLAEMAEALRHPLDVGSAVGAPRRRLT